MSINPRIHHTTTGGYTIWKPEQQPSGFYRCNVTDRHAALVHTTNDFFRPQHAISAASDWCTAQTRKAAQP